MTSRSVAARVRCVYRNVLETADLDDRAFRHEIDFHRTGRVRGVDASSRFIEIDGIGLLSVDQLDDVALGATQFRWSHVCVNTGINIKAIF